MITRVARIVVLLLTIAFLLTACDRGAPPIEPAGAPPAGGIADKLWAPEPDYLQLLYAEPSTYTYEVAFSGTVSVADGGHLYGHPASWGMDYLFSIGVPAGAIDPESIPPGATEVTITCRVPVLNTAFASVDEPMPLIFEPDGLRFTQAASLTLCYHPHLEPTCAGYHIFSADYDPGTGLYTSEEIHFTGVAKGLAPPHPIEILLPDPCAVDIWVDILHFSRWAIDKGNGGGGMDD